MSKGGRKSGVYSVIDENWAMTKIGHQTF